MRKPLFIARQSSCPSGIVGRLVGGVMSRETAPFNEQALGLLDLRADDRLLEIGFGHGRTLERAASALSGGFAAGLDLSETMLRMAERRNRRWVRTGRVELKLGDSARIRYPDRHFDKVLTVHTIYFWARPLDHLGEIRRVLKDGGRLILGHAAREDLKERESNYPDSVYALYRNDEVRELVLRAGLTVEEVVPCRSGNRANTCVIARRRP